MSQKVTALRFNTAFPKQSAQKQMLTFAVSQSVAAAGSLLHTGFTWKAGSCIIATCRQALGVLLGAFIFPHRTPTRIPKPRIKDQRNPTTGRRLWPHMPVKSILLFLCSFHFLSFCIHHTGQLHLEGQLHHTGQLHLQKILHSMFSFFSFRPCASSGSSSKKMRTPLWRTSFAPSLRDCSALSAKTSG